MNSRIRDVCSPNLQVWSILDGSDPKKSKNKMAIFILFTNVKTFYTNIFWYVQPLRSVFLQKDTQKDTHSLRRKPHRRRRSNSSLDSLQALRAWILEFEMSVHQICKFDPFWTDLIKKIQKWNDHFYFFLKCDNFLF